MEVRQLVSINLTEQQLLRKRPWEGTWTKLPTTTEKLKVNTPTPFDISVPKQNIPVGGRLKFFKSQWYNLTRDPQIIEMILGCPIELAKTLPQNNTVCEIKMNKVETEYAKQHIQELLAKRAIVPSTREEGDFCSNVFLCPKPNGKYRMIMNLKILNQFAAKSRFKIETLQSIINLVTKNS